MLIGFITQIGMGITGTLLPLIIGVDHGLHQGRGRAAGATRAADANLSGFPASLLSSEGSANPGGILLGADHHLRACKESFRTGRGKF